MYFPVSDITVNPLFPPLVAFLVSFFGSMGGISGAFLLLPYQISVLGITAPSVSGTNHFFNVIATPSGFYRYYKEQRFVWPLTCFIIIGTLPGLLIGTFLRLTVFLEFSRFKFFVGLVLVYIGSRLIMSLRAKKQKKATPSVSPTAHKKKTVTILVWNRSGFRCEYDGQEYTCPSMKLIVLSGVIGIIGGIYGIGGGAIIAPFLVAMFRLPVHIIGGSTLFATLVTSIWGSLLFYVLAPLYPSLQVSPDWKLGFLLGIGGIVGVYCGARCQKYISGRIIEIGLAIVTIGTGLQYVFG